MKNTPQFDDSKDNPEKQSPASRRLQAGLLLLGSAAFGGLAIALWNRRTLIKMRAEAVEKSQKPDQIDEDAIY